MLDHFTKNILLHRAITKHTMVKVAKLFFLNMNAFIKLWQVSSANVGLKLLLFEYPQKERKRQTTSIVFFINFYFYCFLIYILTCISFICVSDLIP